MKYKRITLVKIAIFVINFLMSCEGQQVNTTNDTQVIEYPMIPKCCLSKTQKWRKQHCVEIQENISFTHFFYESNFTHINNERRAFEPEFYHQPLTCSMQYALDDNEILGMIYNGSIIETVDWILVPPSDYCVDSNNGTMAFIRCVENDNISKGQFYFPCLIVSALSYLVSAAIYQFILKVKDVHKKCFIGFCMSMSITFFCLILFQVVSTQCNILGSVFFLFILASFVWLCCLCVDMAITVKYFFCGVMPERLYLYIAASIIIPCVMLVISIVPSEIPDIPNSFMKEPGKCYYKDDKETRITILFVPMGILLIGSLASLIYTFHLIRLNSKTHKSDIIWLEKKSHFKYSTRSCIMIWITTSIWYVDTVLNDHAHGNPLVYEVIEALQGIFVVAVFITNRYTRKEIYLRFFGKEKRKADSTRFAKLLEKFKTDKCEEKPSTSNVTELES